MTLLIAYSAIHTPNLFGLAAVGIILAVALVGGACWLQLAQTEWRVAPGRIIQQRRFGSRVQPRFAGTVIILSETADSDGDAWYALEVAAAMPSVASERERRRARRKVVSRIHDPSEPRRLAQWLAARSGLPLEDKIQTPAAKAEEAAALLRQLESSGRFGRWAARQIERRVKSRG